jgi:cysteine-rich repeat protein
LIEEPPAPYCGDGNIDPGEECDDGNNDSGDGCSDICTIETPVSAAPAYQFNIGDSIGEAEAANGTIGSINHETVWSTGYDAGDSVNSLNERFKTIDSAGYFENDALSDDIFNRAVSGSVMADFAVQAQEIVDAVSAGMFSFTNGMITILLGNNDVCAPTLDDMTDQLLFEDQYRAGLNILANSPETRDANIHISGIPAIYWLWNAKMSDWWCRLFVWPNVPCENLLSSPADDCASTASRLDPDNIYPGDGTNCTRRKNFHAKIRDIYNPILQDVLQEYISDGRLPNAEFIDIFSVQFGNEHVNGGDCFHPSEAGHSLLSDAEWCLSRWENGLFSCTP